MNEVVIFIYGAVVIAIVAAACTIVARGIASDKRHRAGLDAAADAVNASERRSATAASGDTVPTERPARTRT